MRTKVSMLLAFTLLGGEEERAGYEAMQQGKYDVAMQAFEDILRHVSRDHIGRADEDTVAAIQLRRDFLSNVLAQLSQARLLVIFQRRGDIDGNLSRSCRPRILRTAERQQKADAHQQNRAADQNDFAMRIH